MAIEPPTATGATEGALRERIHRLFSGDCPPVPPQASPPHFWIGPTEEQKKALHLDVEEHIALSDDLEVRAQAQSDEQRWLESPHVELDGMSPEAMLTDGKSSRQRLCSFIAAIEEAVWQGSFS